MIVNITYINEFAKQLKALAKKYRSLADDYARLLDSLRFDPFQGVEIRKGVRKLRISITSKGKGKSSGARVITYSINKVTDEEITIKLLAIYDKSEIDNISESYLNWLLKQITE